MAKPPKVRKALIKLQATPEGLQKVGFYLREGRKHTQETQFRHLKEFGLRRYAALMTEYWQSRGVEEEFFRTRLFRLENAGTENGTWEIEGEDLRLIAPFTYDPMRDRALTYTELLQLAVEAEINDDCDANQQMQIIPKKESSVFPNQGWKLVGAVLASSLQEIAIEDLPQIIERRTAIALSLSDLRKLLTGKLTSQDPNSHLLIMGVFGARIATNPVTKQPYTIEDALAIAAGQLTPINPATGHPFTAEDLLKLGIKNGNGNPTYA